VVLPEPGPDVGTSTLELITPIAIVYVSSMSTPATLIYTNSTRVEYEDAALTHQVLLVSEEVDLSEWQSEQDKHKA
jgi:hypothetical protein